MLRTRIDESRQILVEAFYLALGSYVEQEATKEDRWRDESIGELYGHLKHELDEIKVNLTQPGKDHQTYLLHNCIDAVMLSTIFLAKIMEMGKLNEPVRKVS